MNSIEFQGKTYCNWKDYFLDKFSNKDLFIVEQLDLDKIFLESYRVTSKNGECETEIIYQMHIDEIKYIELYDVHFNNPNSPKHTNENKSNQYGFDGQGSTFNEINLINLDEWIEIPLSKGWIEATTFFEGKEIKTECTWTQNNKSVTIPITQEYLEKYGCLLFPIIPLIVFLTNRKLRKNPTKVKVDKKVIPPMVN